MKNSIDLKRYYTTYNAKFYVHKITGFYVKNSQT